MHKYSDFPWLKDAPWAKIENDQRLFVRDFAARCAGKNFKEHLDDYGAEPIRNETGKVCEVGVVNYLNLSDTYSRDYRYVLDFRVGNSRLFTGKDLTYPAVGVKGVRRITNFVNGSDAFPLVGRDEKFPQVITIWDDPFVIIAGVATLDVLHDPANFDNRLVKSSGVDLTLKSGFFAFDKLIRVSTPNELFSVLTSMI